MTTLTRQQASDGVTEFGWRYVLGVLRTTVPVGSLAEALACATRAADVAGSDADGHLWVDVRHDRVVLSVQTLAHAHVTAFDVDLARRITEALGRLTVPDGVQVVELGIDAMDIPSIRPFWKAVLGYVDEPGRTGPTDPLVDPRGQAPAIWFQQMDQPRPQRNRIHFDVSVPHDEAARRIEATIAAGGRLTYDAEAPAFWVLADAEGNEACVTTWQGRD